MWKWQDRKEIVPFTQLFQDYLGNTKMHWDKMTLWLDRFWYAVCFSVFQKSSKKKEKEKQTCKGCNESFNFTKRKHHCKACGAVSTERRSRVGAGQLVPVCCIFAGGCLVWLIFSCLNIFLSLHSSFSLSLPLQAICGKCSKMLENKACRLCPECFETSQVPEGPAGAPGELKRKATAEVRTDWLSAYRIQ